MSATIKNFFTSEFKIESSVFPTRKEAEKGLGGLKLMKNECFISHRSEIDTNGKFWVYLFLQAQSKYDMRLSRLTYPAIEKVIKTMNGKLELSSEINLQRALRAISSIEKYEWKEQDLIVHIEKGYAFVGLCL